MPISTATVTFDIADHLGNDFDTRRTKIWATTNVPGDTIIDTEGNKIRLGSGNVTLASDGTGSLVVWVPGAGTNPASWQTTIHVDYPDRNGSRGNGRGVRAFGPFTITANADLADLVAEMEIPPDFSSSAFIQEVEAIRDGQIAIAGPVDGAVEALVKNTGGVGPLTSAALSAAIVALLPEFNIRDYGAVGDGTTDDTAAIRAALAACPAGGTVLIPPASDFYLVSQQAESYIFLIDKPLVIRGEGYLSNIGVASGVTATTDVFLIKPPITGDSMRALALDNFQVSDPSTTRPGRHSIHIDLTVTGSALANSTFTRLNLRPLGGKSIKLTNPTSTTGFYGSQMQKNLIWGGIELTRGGDSLTVTENIIAGYNSVDITLIDGSNTFVFAFNNVTCRGGMRIGSGHNMKVLFNNFEVGYSDSTGSNGAILDLDGVEVGQTWGLLATEVRGNNFTYRTVAPNGIHAIRINDARSALVEANHIALKASNHIIVTSAADETIVGYNLFSSTDPFGVVADSGARTVRKDTVRLAPTSGAREMYQAEATALRYRATSEFIINTLQTTLKPYVTNDAHSLVFEWDVANVFSQKHRFKTQRRNADNTLDTAKSFATVGDGVLAFDSGFRQTSTTGPLWRSGSGTPEGAVTAPVGSLFTRSDGGATTTLYIKESGTGNTGWVAK